MSSKPAKPTNNGTLPMPDGMPGDLVSIAEETNRIHESSLWSNQGQFEQMKLWRSMNLVLGVPAAVLAAVAGGTGLAADQVTRTPAILALLAAAFGAALTTLNPSRRVSNAQSAANAYLELQTTARQLLTIDLLDPSVTRETAREELAKLTVRRDEINKTADPPSRYAAWRARQNIEGGKQDYAADEKAD